MSPAVAGRIGEAAAISPAEAMDQVLCVSHATSNTEAKTRLLLLLIRKLEGEPLIP